MKVRDLMSRDVITLHAESVMADAEEVIPELDPPRRSRLFDRLPLDHPWQALSDPRTARARSRRDP